MKSSTPDSKANVYHKYAKQWHPKLRPGEVFLGNIYRTGGIESVPLRIPQTLRLGQTGLDTHGDVLTSYLPIFAQLSEVIEAGILEKDFKIPEVPAPTTHSHEPAGYICPLCQIAKGEITAKGLCEEFVVFRDNLITVFIAGRWWRTNPGHVIIIPNSHVENIYVLPDKIAHAIADMKKRVAIAIRATYYRCEGVSTKQHNEPAGNQEVWHYHEHIIPRYDHDDHYMKGDDMYWPTPDEKRPYAERLRTFLNQ